MDIRDPFYQLQIQEARAAVEKHALTDESAKENALQASCESWLNAHGYCRLTRENAILHGGDQGFYGHLVEPKKNPFMPDLFLFHYTKRFLFVELKIRDAKGKVHYGPGQRQMVESGWWKLATTEDEFAEIVTEWEGHS